MSRLTQAQGLAAGPPGQVIAIIRAETTVTYVSNTNQQALFTTPANGAITIGPGCYAYEAVLGMDTMSGTSGNGKFSLLGAGTATLSKIFQFLSGMDIASDTATNVAGNFTAAATQTSTNLSTAGTATEFGMSLKGAFSCTVGGTIIPSFAQTTAAAAVLKVGSYFMLRYLGPLAFTSIGPVS